MPKQIQPLRRIRTARRLVLIFAIAILAPGLILGFIGVRALIQESGLAEQQIHEGLAVAAESASRQLESELKDWQRAADDIARTGRSDPASWPQRVRQAMAEPGAAVVLLGSRERAEVIPAGQLLYELSPSLEHSRRSAPVSPLVMEAESLELREKRYDAAVILYRQALISAKSGDRAHILNDLARTLKKSGHMDDAVRNYAMLEKEPPVQIGTLPSDLIAIYELASIQEGQSRSDGGLRLYQGLIEGRWRLEEPSYAFYSEWAHEWIPQTEVVHSLAVEEQQKRTLTHAAEELLRQPQPYYLEDGDIFLSFWCNEPFGAILLGKSYMRDHPLVKAGVSGMGLSVVAPDGQIIAGDSIPADAISATTVIQNTGLPLRLQVWPRDPAAMFADIQRQRKLYAGMVAIVLMLLLFGGYFTVRTLKSELAVAQMKSDFVSTVSHEFRSPLAGINQLGEMLRDGRVEDETRRKEYYEMIVTETQRLRRLVENILDFSRMEEGLKQYHFEPFDPAVWLRELTEDFQTRVASEGFRIESNIPATLPPILADRDTLTTAVHNLLDNAIKYSPKSRSVRVAAESDKEFLSISVRDRGVGIRKEDRPRIFEKFYRGGGELARQVKGVGLGLNLVQHIVTAHGGTIEFQSKEGEGSTFTIRLNYDTHIAG